MNFMKLKSVELQKHFWKHLFLETRKVFNVNLVSVTITIKCNCISFDKKKSVMVFHILAVNE